MTTSRAVLIERLEKAAGRLALAESAYRMTHDKHGDGHQLTGRAWDEMRRAGDKVRSEIAQKPIPSENEIGRLLKSLDTMIEMAMRAPLGDYPYDQSDIDEARANTEIFRQYPAIVLTPHVETAWLIELKQSVHQVPHYADYTLGDDWTSDANNALRFARKEDAEAIIRHIGWTEAFASEHIWDDGRAALKARESAATPAEEE